MEPRKAIQKKRKVKRLVDHIHSPHTSVVKSSVRVGPRELKLARALADTDKSVREASTDVLSQWLKRNSSNIETVELKKLWKALFYCVWMAEPHVSNRVIWRIVEIAEFMKWIWLKELFVCIVTEWAGIDCHRVDKFYQMLNEALKKCAILVVKDEKLSQGISSFLEIICESVFDDAAKRAKGVTLHILDKWVDLIVKPVLKAVTQQKEIDHGEVLQMLLDPIYPFMGRGVGSLLAVGKRAREQVLNRLIELVECKELEHYLSDEDRRNFLTAASKKVFSVAASKKTDNNVRRFLYEAHTNLKIQAFRRSAE